ncbi:MAG: glutathione S-transferase family protein, partial [Pseudomonadota bacterium]
MANITLYHFPRACSQVTMNALEEAGLEYDDIVINILKGEQKSPDYLKIHRSGKVPALVFDGKVMTENASILIFLDSLKPEAHLLPKTDDPVAKANMYSDLIWCSGTIHPAVRQVRMPVRFTDGDPSGVQEKGREYVHGIIAQVNEQVADGNWWYGEQWSIVDVYLNWLFTTAASAGFPVEQYPNVQDHMQRVQ